MGTQRWAVLRNEDVVIRNVSTLNNVPLCILR